MLMSVTTKVAMQLNCKLGGELWAVEIPVSSSSSSSTIRLGGCCNVWSGQNSALNTVWCVLRFTLADIVVSFIKTQLRQVSLSVP